MKKLIIAMALSMSFGCSMQKEMVPVDKPFPACPKPPVTATYDMWVDQLTDADLNDPGKVGQAYKHDMIYLRKRIAIDQQILEQYDKTSTNYDQAKQQIDKAYESLNK